MGIEIKNKGRHAYLIMAHKSYEDLIFLLKTIDDERNDIFIHIDRKWKSFDKSKITNIIKFSNVFFTKRLNVKWGCHSIMNAEMILYEYAVRGNYDYYHLLSGQDMCLKSQNYIHDYFYENSGKEFISFCKEEKWNSGLKNRMKFYYLSNRFKNNFYSHLNALFIRLQKFFHINRIKKIKFQIVGGSEWCSLSNSAVHFLIQKQKELKRKFVYASCIDEIYKQVIFFNSEFKDKIFQSIGGGDSSLRFIDWANSSAKGNPKILGIEDFERITKTTNLFGRKFSFEHDKEIQKKILNSLGIDDEI